MNDYLASPEALLGDRVMIEDLRIPAFVGVYPHEKAQKQIVALNVEVGLSTQVCFQSDQVGDTIDYAALAEALRKLAISRHFNLIETLAEHAANVALVDFGALWVKIRINKIGVVPNAKSAAVAITRLNADTCKITPLSPPEARARSGKLLLVTRRKSEANRDDVECSSQAQID